MLRQPFRELKIEQQMTNKGPMMPSKKPEIRLIKPRIYFADSQGVLKKDAMIRALAEGRALTVAVVKARVTRANL